MRVLVATALAAATVSLVGCNEAAKPAAAPNQSPTPVAAPAAVSVPSPVVTAPRGKFDAISNTAMGVTGDLSAADGDFAFSQGQTYRLEGAGQVRGADPYASTSLASLINIADTAVLKVFKVTSEDRARARNGGFCGAEPTTFILTHEGVDGSGAPALFLMAFKGANPPSATSAETDLCGTFMYAPSAGPPATK